MFLTGTIRWLLKMRTNKLMNNNVFKTFVNVQLTEKRGSPPRTGFPLSLLLLHFSQHTKWEGGEALGKYAPPKNPAGPSLLYPRCPGQTDGGRFFLKAYYYNHYYSGATGGRQRKQGRLWKKLKGGLPRKGRRRRKGRF